MKSSTVLAVPLLLVVLASAVPLQDSLGPVTLTLDLDKLEADVEVKLQDLLEADPSLQDQLDPDRLRDASGVELTVDQEVLLQVLLQQQQQHQAEEEGEASDLDHERGKRNAFGFGNYDSQGYGSPYGNPFPQNGGGLYGQIGGSHTWDNGRNEVEGSFGRSPRRGGGSIWSGQGSYTRNHDNGGRTRVWVRGEYRNKRSIVGETVSCDRYGVCRVKISGRHSPQLLAAALAPAQ